MNARASRIRRRAARAAAGRQPVPAVSALEPRRLLSGGDLDATFGVGGKVTTDLPASTQNFGMAMVRQPDGKVVVVGTSMPVMGRDTDFAVTRFHPDGTPDAGFGDGGTAVVDFDRRFEQAQGVALDAAGNIVVAGYSAVDGRFFGLDFAVARLTPDGALDPTFDGDGRRRVDFSGGEDEASAVEVQSDGRIVLAGRSRTTAAGSRSGFALARLDADGSDDATFGAGGRVVQLLGTRNATAADVAVDGAGRIVAAGYAEAPGADFAVARYNPDGTRDTTFDGDGVVTTPVHNSNDYASAVALAPGGKIVVGGQARSTSTTRAESDFAAVRYLDNGALDATFDLDGKATVDFGGFAPGPTYRDDRAYGMAVDGQGRVVLVGESADPGTSYPPPPGHFAVARLTATGRLDSSFSLDGRYRAGFPSALVDVVFEPGGAVVATGTTSVVVGTSGDALLARIGAGGTPDPLFGGPGGRGDGTVAHDVIGPGYQTAHAVAIDAAGRILTGGDSEVYRGERGNWAITRHLADGTLDASFGRGGVVLTDFAGQYDDLHALLVQPDGKILAAGMARGGDTGEDGFAVARYTPDGALDPTFGGGTGKVMLVMFDNLWGGDEAAHAMALDEAGRIVLAGWAQPPNGGSGTAIGVARLLPSGDRDVSFGGEGMVRTVVAGAGSAWVMAHAVAVAPGGKVVVAGGAGDGGSAFVVVRYNDNGTLDGTFDGDGITVTAFVPGDVTSATSVAVDAAGRITAGGTTAGDFALARYNPDGTLDSTFGTGGRVTTDVAGFGDILSSLVLLPDGSVVATGTAATQATGGGSTPWDVAVVRYTPTGALDARFGGDGKVTTDFYGGGDNGEAVAVDAEGRVVVAGTAVVPGRSSDFALVRYEGVPRDTGVADVFLGGSSWAAGFRSALAGAGLGGAAGFEVEDGAAPLPWANVDRVTANFTRPLTAGDVSLRVRGTNVAEYAVAGFSLAADGMSATWTLARPVGADRISVEIDTGGDAPAHRLTASVLPGDANRSGGAVNAADVLAVRRARTAYSPFRDLNGDGRVNALDEALARLNQRRQLPAGPAPAALSGEARPLAAPARPAPPRRDLFGVAPILA